MAKRRTDTPRPSRSSRSTAQAVRAGETIADAVRRQRTAASAGDRVEDMAYSGGQLTRFRKVEKLLRRAEIPKAILLSGCGNDVAGKEFFMLLDHAASPAPALNEDIVRGVVDVRGTPTSRRSEPARASPTSTGGSGGTDPWLAPRPYGLPERSERSSTRDRQAAETEAAAFRPGGLGRQGVGDRVQSSERWEVRTAARFPQLSGGRRKPASAFELMRRDGRQWRSL